MSALTDETTEDEIPDLSDQTLSELVAEWADDISTCSYCAGSGVESQHTQKTCRQCEGAGECWPDYCNDDAAAWRLQRRFPRVVEWTPGSHLSVGGPNRRRRMVLYDLYKGDRRALAEVGGVDPREVPE